MENEIESLINNIHIKKEDFIKMLNELKFHSIKYANIQFITGFEYNAKENITKPMGFDITIE